MTIENLKERLLDGAKKLEQLHQAIDEQRASTSVPEAALEQFNSFPILAQHLRSAVQLLAVRVVAEQTLDGIRTNGDSDSNTVVFAGATIPFSSARLLGFQSYLSSTWAVSDLVTRVPGYLIGNKSAANMARPAKLWEHFVKDNNTWPHHPGAIFRAAYAWPVALSYIIRNHFMHDGACDKGSDFFAGERSTDGYSLSESGIGYIVKKTGTDQYNVNEKMSRLDKSPLDETDLLKLLELCHGQIDEVLGHLVMLAVEFAVLHTKALEI